MTPRAIRNPSEFPANHYRAVVTYNILFGGPLVISDSIFVTDLNFRDAIFQNDPFTCGLIESKYIRLAIRTKNGSAIPLREVSASIRERGGHAHYISSIRDESASEFDYLERHAAIVPYTLESASGHYRDQMLRVLESIEFRDSDLPKVVADAVTHTVRMMIAEGHPLAWSTFQKGSELWLRLKEQLGEDLWPRHGVFLDSVARGPHVTFLPQCLDLSSAFSNEDRLGVEMWRGRYELTKEELAAKIFQRPRLSLSDYVDGLSALRCDDILKLRKSPALQAYEHACRAFSEGALQGMDPLDALIEYRREVDFTILDALQRRISNTSEDVCRVSLLSRGKNEAASWLSFGIKAIADTLSGGAFAPIEFGYKQIQKMLGRDEVTLAKKDTLTEVGLQDREREVQIAKLHQQGSSTIGAEVIVDQPMIRDLFTSVDPSI